MRVNGKVAILLLGLLVGAVAGYLTRPATARIGIGQMSVEFNDNQASLDQVPLNQAPLDQASPLRASGLDDDLTGGQTRHILLYTIGGGVAGLLIGFALDRRRGF